MNKRKNLIFRFACLQLGYWGYYATFAGYITSLMVENGISNTSLSVAVFGYQLCAFTNSFLLGKVCDRLQSNRKPIITLGTVTLLLSILLTVFSADNRFIAVIYAMIGFVYGPVISCLDAWILRTFREEDLYGKLRAIGPFTLAAGMLLQGQFIRWYGYGIMILGGVIFLGIFLLAGIRIPDVIPQKDRQVSHSARDLRILLSNREYLFLLLTLLLVGVSVAPVNNLKVSILRNLGGDVGWYGADNFFGIIMQVPFLILSGKILRLPGKIRYALMGVLPLGMLILDLFAVHPMMVILGTCVNNIAYAIQIPTMREVTEHCVAREQRNLGHNLTDAVYGCMSGMLSAVYAGVLMDRAGMHALFAVCLSTGLMACVLILFLREGWITIQKNKKIQIRGKR